MLHFFSSSIYCVISSHVLLFWIKCPSLSLHIDIICPHDLLHILIIFPVFKPSSFLPLLLDWLEFSINSQTPRDWFAVLWKVINESLCGRWVASINIQLLRKKRFLTRTTGGHCNRIVGEADGPARLTLTFGRVCFGKRIWNNMNVSLKYRLLKWKLFRKFDWWFFSLGWSMKICYVVC